jgi:hypothetical protein
MGEHATVSLCDLWTDEFKIIILIRRKDVSGPMFACCPTKILWCHWTGALASKQPAAIFSEFKYIHCADTSESTRNFSIRNSRTDGSRTRKEFSYTTVQCSRNFHQFSVHCTENDVPKIWSNEITKESFPSLLSHHFFYPWFKLSISVNIQDCLQLRRKNSCDVVTCVARSIHSTSYHLVISNLMKCLNFVRPLTGCAHLFHENVNGSSSILLLFPHSSYCFGRW